MRDSFAGALKPMQPQAPVVTWGRDANGLPVPMGQ
jgi:hypothetical protein